MLVSLLACEGAFAQKAPFLKRSEVAVWTPTAIHWPEENFRGTVPRPMVESLMVKGVPVELEETTLESLKKKLGGVIGNHGDGGDSLAWICYTGVDASGPWIFWPTSSEMGGLSTINGFVWRHLETNERADWRCRELPSGDRLVELPLALHPGMTETEIRGLLGKPTLVRGQDLYYAHEHLRRIRKEDWSVWNGVALALRDGRLWALSVNKTTTN